MTPFDDDRADMDILPGAPRLSDSDAEALLAGRAVPGWDDLHGSVRVLRSASPPPAPAPSAALLAVLEAGFDPLPVVGAATRPAAWRRTGARAAVAAAAVFATTLGAAAANALPAPVQNAVAAAVSAVTPLDLPRADDGSRADPDDAPDAPATDSTDAPTTDAPTTDAPGDGLAPLLPPERSELTAPGASKQNDQPPAAPGPTTRDEPDTGEPDDVDEPDTDEPDDVDEPDEPDEVDEPDTDEPDDVDEPDEVDEPDTDEPDDAGEPDDIDIDSREADDDVDSVETDVED